MLNMGGHLSFLEFIIVLITKIKCPIATLGLVLLCYLSGASPPVMSCRPFRPNFEFLIRKRGFENAGRTNVTVYLSCIRLH
jgi:hypothetical protein